MVPELCQVSADLKQRFGGRRVELYYGALNEDGSATFEAF